MATFLQHCRDNNIREVKDCLTQGTDVNTVSEDGRWSALTIAAHKSSPELLNILLSHPDIQINKTTRLRNGQNFTALMFACKAGITAIVSRLVEVPGLDIMYQDRWGYTAALLAITMSQPECLRILAGTGRVTFAVHPY